MPPNCVTTPANVFGQSKITSVFLGGSVIPAIDVLLNFIGPGLFALGRLWEDLSRGRAWPYESSRTVGIR